MVKNEFFKSQLIYFIFLTLMIYVCGNIQSTFFAQIGTPWLHIDLISIIIAYLCLEHHILFATVQGILAGAFMQMNSSSPHIFFILYFMLVVVLSNTLSKLFVVNSLISKIIIFSFLYFIKYILFYFSINNRLEIGVSRIFSDYWKEYAATCIAAFLFYKLLLLYDALFVLPGSIKKR
ncbi:MAG: hypothetical protein V4591_09820 [Bdellovibrionota bacterium]